MELQANQSPAIHVELKANLNSAIHVDLKDKLLINATSHVLRPVITVVVLLSKAHAACRNQQIHQNQNVYQLF